MIKFTRLSPKHLNLLLLLGPLVLWFWCFSLLPAVASEVKAVWTDEKLARYLEEGNRPEAVLIRNLEVRQDGQSQPLYNQLGIEEKRRQLQERPVLRPAEAGKPFVRSTRLVARVDRNLDIRIIINLQLIRRGGEDKHKVRRKNMDQLTVRFKYDSEAEILKASNGQFAVLIARERYCGGVSLSCISGDERHEIKLIFLNRKFPVTFVK